MSTTTAASLKEDTYVVDKLDVSDCRELGSDAVFTISSSKPGNGVEQLRDNNLETYWQSDVELVCTTWLIRKLWS
eukprot:gene30418-39660_t